MKHPLLSIEHLKVVSATGAELVRDVSLKIEPGQILGLVGESGCGKSITALTVCGLLPKGIEPVQGKVLLNGQDITDLSVAERMKINGNHIGMVFQDASATLNPVVKIGRQIGEVLKIHTDLSRTDRRKRVLQVMADVGLPEPDQLYHRYPSELSGGQRQRVLIAMAIINRPKLVICDEPTTALDVRIQAQILALLKQINERDGVSILLISHDLYSVQSICDHIAVLYAGMPAEIGKTADVCGHPRHVYTRLLMGCVPTPDQKGEPLMAIRGRVTDHRGEAHACLFAPRCPLTRAECLEDVVPLMKMGHDHWAACYAYDEPLPIHIKESWDEYVLQD